MEKDENIVMDVDAINQAIEAKWTKLQFPSGKVFATFKGELGSVRLEMVNEVRIYNRNEFSCYSGSDSFKSRAIEQARTRNILDGANLKIEIINQPAMFFVDGLGNQIDSHLFNARPTSLLDVEVALSSSYDLFTVDK